MGNAQSEPKDTDSVMTDETAGELLQRKIDEEVKRKFRTEEQRRSPLIQQSLRSSPVFRPDPKGRTDIISVPKGFFQERSSTTIPPHLTFTLPKGTMLFRGIRKSTSSKGFDVMGPWSSEYGDKNCIPPNYQVYFYPYPFASNTIGIKGLNRMMIYVTTQDIQMLCLVSPSQYTRASLDKNIITRCSDISSFGCGLQGRAYDSCFTKDYMDTFPDVTGILAIAKTDMEGQQFYLNQMDGEFKKYMGSQIGMITDARSITSTDTAVPEIVLSPFNRTLAKPYTDVMVPLGKFRNAYEDILTYEVFAVLHRSDANESEVEDFMTKILSTEGYHGYHAGIDKQTGFYRIKELSAPFESTTSVVRKEEPEFVFKRTSKFKQLYGRNRKTRRGPKRRF